MAVYKVTVHLLWFCNWMENSYLLYKVHHDVLYSPGFKFNHFWNMFLLLQLSDMMAKKWDCCQWVGDRQSKMGHQRDNQVDNVPWDANNWLWSHKLAPSPVYSWTLKCVKIGVNRNTHQKSMIFKFGKNFCWVFLFTPICGTYSKAIFSELSTFLSPVIGLAMSSFLGNMIWLCHWKLTEA